MKLNKIHINNYKIDKERDNLVVDVEFYQMDLQSVITKTKKEETKFFIENNDFLPSWAKVSKNPIKARGFLTVMFQALLESKHNLLDIDIYQQFHNIDITGQKIIMVWFPGSTTNKNLTIISNILDQVLSNYMIIQINGDTMTNATAEKEVLTKIEIAKNKGMNVLLVSAGMAARSFSIKDLDTIFLAYDSGVVSATTQKISRALTPNKENKIGRIVSLSFDPNRDDKFDDILMESAKNLAKNKNININEALKTVLKTVSLSICTEDGAKIINKDDYLKQLISNNRIDRVIGRMADLSKLSIDQIKIIASGKVDYNTLSKVEKSEMGKTCSVEKEKSKKSKRINDEQKLIMEAKKVITTISENFDILMTQGGKTVDETFSIIDKFPKEDKEAIHQLFDIDYESIKNIVNNVMNKKLLELKYSSILEN